MSTAYSSDPALEALQDILHDDATSTATISSNNLLASGDAPTKMEATTLIQQSRAFRFQVVDDFKSTCTGSSTSMLPSLTSIICEHSQPQCRSRTRPRRLRSNSSIATFVDSSRTSTTCTLTQALGIIDEREDQEIQKDDEVHVDNDTSACDHVVPLAPPAEPSCSKKDSSLQCKASAYIARFSSERGACKIDHRLALMDQLLERSLEEDLLERVDNMPLDSQEYSDLEGTASY